MTKYFLLKNLLRDSFGNKKILAFFRLALKNIYKHDLDF